MTGFDGISFGIEFETREQKLWLLGRKAFAPRFTHDVNKIAGVKADVDDILSGDATGLCSREGLPGFGSLEGGNEGHFAGIVPSFPISASQYSISAARNEFIDWFGST